MTTPERAIQFVAGGTVQAGDGVYVERAADGALHSLCREGAFAYVLTSRQMGKSSLMIRTAEKLLEDGIKPVIVDLTELGANTTAGQWYRGFLQRVAEQLELRTSVGVWWDANEHLSFAQRFNQFIADVVLKEVDDSIVVFVDEIDTTLRLDFTDDFFASIRYLYHARASHKDFGRLSFVLLGVASPSDLMKDPERTPFNIGRRVDLDDFTEEEAVRDLHAKPELVRSVFRYTGGHPYLTLRVFRSLSEQPLSSGIEERVEALFFGDQAAKDSNLQFVRDMLTKRAPDREAILLRYRDIWKGKEVADQEADPVCAWLRLSGVVRPATGCLEVRNLIYRTVFNLHWIQTNRKINWARRASLIAAAAFGLLVLLAAGLSPYAWQQSRLARNRQHQAEDALRSEARAHREETQARAAAEVNAKEATRQTKMALTNEYEAKRQEGIAKENAVVAQRNARESKARELAALALEGLGENPERSVLLAVQAVNITVRAGEPPVSSASDALQRAILSMPLQRSLAGHSGPVRSVAFSPDGKRLVTGDAVGAVVWEVGSERQLLLLRQSASVNGAAFSPDGRLIATASQDGTANLWDAASGQELLTFHGNSGAINGLAFSPDGRTLVTASQDGTTKIWDVASGREVQTLSQPSSTLGVAFSPDGRLIATASQDGTANLWDAASGRELRSLRGHLSAVNGIAFSPDGKTLVTASQDGTTKIWDVEIGRELQTLRQSSSTLGVAFSRNNRLIATGGQNGIAKVWDAASGQELLTFHGNSGAINGLAFSPDGRTLATATEDQTTQLWALGSGEALPSLRGHDGTVTNVTYSPDGKRMATAASDDTAKVWDAVNGAELLTLSGHSDVVNGVAFGRDGKLLATGSSDHTARVWDAVSGKELRILRGHSGAVNSVAFGGDGKRLATGSSDDTARVWDAVSGRELLILSGHSGAVNSVAFDRDGKRLATGSSDKTAKVWDVVSGHELLTLRGHSGPVLGVAFSPDGNYVATASQDGTAKVWDALAGRQLLTLRGHSGSVLGLSYSLDGKLLATASQDGTAMLWSAKDGQELQILPGHSGIVTSVAFGPDGKRLASSGSDGIVQVYALDIRELLSLARNRVTRNLTPDECKRYLQTESCPPLP